MGEGSVVTWGWIKVEGGDTRDRGEGRVLEVTTTCLTGGLEGGEVMQLVCKDSTYHLGLGKVGGGVFTSFIGDLDLGVVFDTGLGIFETVAIEDEEMVTVS